MVPLPATQGVGYEAMRALVRGVENLAESYISASIIGAYGDKNNQKYQFSYRNKFAMVGDAVLS